MPRRCQGRTYSSIRSRAPARRAVGVRDLGDDPGPAARRYEQAECPTTATTMTCGFAYNTQLFGGRGPIHICFARPPGCNFTTIPAPYRIALVIHEAAHR